VVTALLEALVWCADDATLMGYKFNLRSKLRHKMGHLETVMHYAVATLLDPRLANKPFPAVFN